MRGRRDELRDMADAFDSMVARVEGDVERKRRFVANAFHELRTPLAVSGALIEVAQADPDPDVAALLTGLGNANARATDLTHELLLMTRLEAKPPQTGPVDLSLAAEGAEDLQGDRRPTGSAARRRRPTGHRDRRRHAAEPTGAEPRPERDRAQPARTRAGRDLDRDARRTLGAQGRQHRASDRSHPAGRAGRALPTWRRPHALRPHASGLGLAIASSIVESLSGTLTLAAGPEGGLMVEASFPLAKDARGPGHAPGTRLR